MSQAPDRRFVLGYVRVSTSDQAASGLGLAAQEESIRAACAHRGWTLLDVVHDDGLSGKDMARPGLQTALQRIAQGEAQGLAAAKLDRLSRSLVDAAALMSWFDEAGAALVAVDMQVDTSTAAGRLVTHVMAAVAEWERSTISTRTREAAAVRRQRGDRMGRPSVREVMPEVAERIKTARSSGQTWQAIANALNQDGIPTARSGTAWRVSSVQAAAGYVRPPSKRHFTPLPELPRRRRAS